MEECMRTAVVNLKEQHVSLALEATLAIAVLRRYS